MGSVWVADHLTLKTQVAVKFMSASVAKDPTLVARFTREATAAAQIRSPHVVQVFDHGVTSEGEPFIVMELLEGEDLAARVARLGPMSCEHVGLVLNQIAKALTKAHQVGIVHRDIKPSNVFLVDMGGEIFANLLDFGIAKQPDSSGASLTSTRETVGTPLYMSPEQFLSLKHVDWRSDLWSLGGVAYFALTGVEPFRGETLGAIYVVIERGDFTPPSSLRPDIPDLLDSWFTRVFSRQPSDRFASAKEMADEFVQIVGGRVSRVTGGPLLPVEGRERVSRPSTLTGTSAMPERSSSLRVPAALSALLVVASIAIGLFVLRRDAAPPLESVTVGMTPASAREANAPSAPALAEVAVTLAEGAPSPQLSASSSSTPTPTPTPTALPSASSSGRAASNVGKAAAPSAPPATPKPAVTRKVRDRGF